MTVNHFIRYPIIFISLTSPKYPYTGLKEGVEPVRDTPFSVKLDKSGKVVTRKCCSWC